MEDEIDDEGQAQQERSARHIDRVCILLTKPQRAPRCPNPVCPCHTLRLHIYSVGIRGPLTFCDLWQRHDVALSLREYTRRGWGAHPTGE